ncbi:Crp/Fnr family transcriptional regulator [Companilactobacillus jidongensis]|uniref:Crp/Fnr family transcriptional regulator n=1 Tax=Companilactobacillus jidongensis TaxID=2486006 RepID=UPI001CDC283C|nr:Crp/Fnr family transcriptional regulator [Companilactobacillus jidongensis]
MMQKEFSNYLKNKFPAIEDHWDELGSLFVPASFAKGTTLLDEGDVAAEVYIVIQGALRLWHNDNGRDITLQFFFENQMVSSFESFYLNKPSGFSIECVEDTKVLKLSKKDFDMMRHRYPAIESSITSLICERFIEYRNIFFSQIQHSPEERYRELADNDPEVLERVPLHFVASYLGITPVSLSRIRKRNL